VASRSAFVQWRAEKRARLMSVFANLMFRKGEGGASRVLRQRMMPSHPDAPLDPDLEHPDP
jgi:hypothetical protein